MQQFHAFVVNPGKQERLSLPDLHVFHLSIVSLPSGKTGRTTLYVTVDGKPYAVATIDSNAQGKPLQVPTDLLFNANQDVTFHAKGAAPLHCVGYIQSIEEDDGQSFPHGEDSEDDFSLPIESAQQQMKNKRPRVEEDSDDEEDEDLSDEYEEVQPKKRSRLADPTQAGSDDEEEDKEQDEGDEEEDDEEDDDEEEDDEEEGNEEEDDEEDDDEEDEDESEE